jgi:hypothetical protein
MKEITSIRAVYALMSLILLLAFFLQEWGIVIFVVLMLQLGVWGKFCPSKWLAEKVGFKKTEL